ncbi:helix-turn-helix domain-containing protein [Kitasatospora sp. MBT63]|uniref:helix-turn-helix domain-containing protein n=1 Tax=Kitasatospora sp. MBT63 TaxID=1444768 RepID=UPI0011EA6616|nr:helix-turn-helix domain-containing protein [Kitasatospora sp. MBT63]
MTDITRSGDGIGGAADRLSGVNPAAPLVPGQRQELVGGASATGAVVSKAARRFVPCVAVLPRLLVLAAGQWVTTTRGRVALDPYSWMQAVHWVVASGCYTPAWSHGPKEMGRTTIRVAQELAALSPCRPGVEYLARKLKTTDRTVQNHLRMLREAGLVVYVVKGTRVRGERARASEFALAIPAAFDVALGVRTSGEGTGRRVVGIAEAGRAVMALLGKRASRKVRAARSKASTEASVTTTQDPSSATQPPVSQAAAGASGAACRCTPMEGGCCTSSTDRSTHLPSESKLAAGTDDSSTSGKQQRRERTGKPKRRVLNRVGRRYQLAFELIQRVPWLSKAAVARVAWVTQELADDGWTVNEVLAWLDLRQEPDRVRRPSAFLAARLRGALATGDTAAKRRRLVEAWLDNRRATAGRHQEWEGAWAQPRSQYVRNLVVRAVACCAPSPAEAANATVHGEDDPGMFLEDLTREEVRHLRGLAQHHPDLVLMAIGSQGEDYARRLYTNAVVDKLLSFKEKAPAYGSRMVVHGGWGQA